MIRSLHLRNFKCFEHLILPTSPLTMLTGFNAAGKSTSLQPMLLISQYLRSARQGSMFSLDGPLASLGTPSEVLPDSEQRKENRILLGIDDDDCRLAWTLRLDDSDSANFQIADFKVSDSKTRERTVDVNQPLWRASLPSAIKRSLDRLERLICITPVRLGVPEIFPSPVHPDPVGDVGLKGEYAPYWLARCSDDVVAAERRHPTEPASTLRRQLNAWAGELFPGADINAAVVSRTSFVRLELRTGIKGDYRQPANMGFGLTYAVPILIALLLALPGQVIVIDSPEAHLHPRAQSAMGRILAKIAAAGVQIFVETHSDHILNGVRLAIRNGDVAPSDATVHFFGWASDEIGRPGRVTTPTFASDGSVSNWPDGFFDQAENDQAVLAGWT